MQKPPPIPQPKSLRFAATLNLIVPGAGQFYLGQKLVGCLLATVFIVCLVSMLIIFFVGYSQYLNAAMGNDILQGQEIEKLGNVFHTRWQIGLLITAIAIYIGSLVGLSASRPR
jgi:TM2 domain-containing membrane protein YozV